MVLNGGKEGQNRKCASGTGRAEKGTKKGENRKKKIINWYIIKERE